MTLAPRILKDRAEAAISLEQAGVWLVVYQY